MFSLATKQAPDENFVLFDEISVLRKTNHIAEMGFGTFKTDATCTNILKQTCQKSLAKMEGISRSEATRKATGNDQS